MDEDEIKKTHKRKNKITSRSRVDVGLDEAGNKEREVRKAETETEEKGEVIGTINDENQSINQLNH